MTWNNFHIWIQRSTWTLVGSTATLSTFMGAQTFSHTTQVVEDTGEHIQAMHAEQSRRLAIITRIDDNSAACRRLLEMLYGPAPGCAPQAHSTLTPVTLSTDTFNPPGAAE
jgi:hypothetical protein